MALNVRAAARRVVSRVLDVEDVRRERPADRVARKDQRLL